MRPRRFPGKTSLRALLLSIHPLAILVLQLVGRQVVQIAILFLDHQLAVGQCVFLGADRRVSVVESKV